MSPIPSTGSVADAEPENSQAWLDLDGDFESPARGVGPVEANAGERIGAWFVDYGNVDHIGTYWDAAHGTHSIDLNGCTNGSISRVLETTPGEEYAVAFAMSGNPEGGPSTKQMDVGWGANGSTAHATTHYTFDASRTSNTDMRWEYKRINLTATSNQMVLSFTSLMVDQCYGPVIDDVSVAMNSIVLDRKGLVETRVEAKNQNATLLSDYGLALPETKYVCAGCEPGHGRQLGSYSTGTTLVFYLQVRDASSDEYRSDDPNHALIIREGPDEWRIQWEDATDANFIDLVTKVWVGGGSFEGQYDETWRLIRGSLDSFVTERNNRSTPTEQEQGGYPDDGLDWTSDGCSAPQGDTGRSYNFRKPCQRHDFGYRNLKRLQKEVWGTSKGKYWNEREREKIDKIFRQDMYDHCNRRSGQRGSCKNWAETYFQFVRKCGDRGDKCRGKKVEAVLSN